MSQLSELFSKSVVVEACVSYRCGGRQCGGASLDQSYDQTSASNQGQTQSTANSPFGSDQDFGDISF